ncbi:hypothetical protein MKK75_09110 [Methylobacterium sp. J-030]|uniref:hypothetical protein n=1 Tax=Methylobacterium sp. J-030 TaxID=2836627 RepID=UPI001FB870C7|nr:hypothetical protein [Methylobacterium sp. J-030]MCJ2068958.1 hypothetical protein [Methylobacterium sp. J-030]
MAEFTGQASNIRFILSPARRGLALSALSGLVALGLAGVVGHMRARRQDGLFATTPGRIPAVTAR